MTIAKICILLSVFLCLTLGMQAQNLVLNPSFENTSTCPTGISRLNNAIDWGDANSAQDSCSTPDLYATCSSSDNNSPNGLLGYQSSRTGTHHAGIILLEGFPGCALLNDNYREYVEGSLSTPLILGQQYTMSFYLSLPEGVMFATSSLGVYFSDTLYQQDLCHGQLINKTPQLNYCGPPITDTANWVLVKWIYTAAGGEQYFTIGNFNNDSATQLTSFNCSSFNPYAYYYIDDVSMKPYQSTDGCAFGLNVDTIKVDCGVTNGAIRPNVAGCTGPFNYLWSNGVTDTTLENIGAGNYSVTITDALGCVDSASFSLALKDFSISIAGLNSTCGLSDGSAHVFPVNGTPPFTYLWSNGDVSKNIDHLNAGVYTVTVTGAAGCSLTATSTLISLGGFTLADTVWGGCGLGNNGTAAVTVVNGTGAFTYDWSNGQHTPAITGLSDGTYTVTVYGDTASNLFWTEDFTSGGNGWTLNADSSSLNGNRPNLWIVNADNSCSCSNGDFLHITCNPASLSCTSSSGQCTYATGVINHNPIMGDVSTDKMAVSPVISTVGKSNMRMTFRFAAFGQTAHDYGLVRFSADSGVTWVDVPTQYSDVANCSQGIIDVPAMYENKPGFRFAFRWINNNDAIGDDPGFAIDDIALYSGPGVCSATASVVVGAPAIGQQLCLVGADTATSKNMVVWEKANKYATDSFYIYRGDISGTVLQQIVALPRDSFSIYEDVTSYPDSQSYWYKIGVLDTCGNVSALSYYHQTIYLQHLGSGNFEWTPYEIENTPNPVSAYRLYRDALGNGNWQLVGATTGGHTTISDPLYAQYVQPVYKLVASLYTSCNPSRALNTVTSNIVVVHNTVNSIDNKEEVVSVKLFYDASVSKAELRNIGAASDLQLVDNLGKVLQAKVNTNESKMNFDLSSYASGIYFVNVYSAGYKTTFKVIRY